MLSMCRTRSGATTSIHTLTHTHAYRLSLTSKKEHGIMKDTKTDYGDSLEIYKRAKEKIVRKGDTNEKVLISSSTSTHI